MTSIAEENGSAQAPATGEKPNAIGWAAAFGARLSVRDDQEEDGPEHNCRQGRGWRTHLLHQGLNHSNLLHKSYVANE